jgi:SpoVK/Ycf46/Vps4 family AAA+-type ATPase
VLSKYIGETEQNLDRIFEAARVGGVILLFDEADALFGKRSEVKDAHDRYANLGTAYLLQRIENAPSPTILTTNLKDGLDPAFTRRLHFIIDFPFPDEPSRRQIWASIFPSQVPVHGLEPGKLAQLAVTGATISNIARRSAFLAAGDAGQVEMPHLREGALRELRQTDRPPAREELEGW